MFDFIAKPLGQFLYFLYLYFDNYGIALITFTLIIKLALLPLMIKQSHSASKISTLQPQLQEIQKLYKDDKEKLQLETAKIYQENKANPLGGCLPSLIQLPVLFSLFYVITQPLKFMLSKTPEQIEKIIKIIPDSMRNIQYIQINALNYINEHTDILSQLGGVIKESELINLNFLGLNLSWVPKLDFNLLSGPQAGQYIALALMPLIGAAAIFISTKLSMKQNTVNQGSKLTQNYMLFVGPLMTLIVSFQMPAGVILYWIVGYLFQIPQQIYINKYIHKHNVRVSAVGNESAAQRAS